MHTILYRYYNQEQYGFIFLFFFLANLDPAQQTTGNIPLTFAWPSEVCGPT